MLSYPYMKHRFTLYVLAFGVLAVLIILGRLSLREPLTETMPATTTLGFIREVTLTSMDTDTIRFDDAVWLTGEAAERAAIIAGLCTTEDTSDCTPNGYFIENANSTPVALKISPSVEIEMETYETGEPGDKIERVDLKTFAGLVNDPRLHWNKLPYHVTVENGVVTKIVEQYVP